MIVSKFIRKMMRRRRRHREDPLREDFDPEKWEYLSDMRLEDADGRAREELRNYLREDFRRFCITFSLIEGRDEAKDLFEIGGNPYYLTALLRKYTNFRVECGNCFDDGDASFYKSTQTLVNGDGSERMDIEWVNLNIEKNWYGGANGQWDIVCFCEVFEHMVDSPVRALLNINRMLKAGGTLIMSTPNVNRLENIARMLAGANIYDPYSGYGRYGRHNREYNKHELGQLLELCGFEAEIMFTRNVHDEYAGDFFDISRIMPLVESIPNRELDLGQYIFIRAKKRRDARQAAAPDWLYRSMSDPVIRAGERAD